MAHIGGERITHYCDKNAVCQPYGEDLSRLGCERGMTNRRHTVCVRVVTHIWYRCMAHHSDKNAACQPYDAGLSQ